MIHETLAKSANYPNGKNPVSNAISIPTPIVIEPGIPFLFNLVKLFGSNPSLLIVNKILIEANIVANGPAKRPITAPNNTIPATLSWPTTSNTYANASPFPS